MASGPDHSSKTTEQLTVVMAAMAEEVAPLKRRMTHVTAVDRAALPGPPAARAEAWRGAYAQHELLVVVTGEGEACARAAARAVVEMHDPARIIIVGVAGGISPDLEVGDLVVAEEVVYAHGRLGTVVDRFVLDSTEAGVLAQVPGARLGQCISTSGMVLSVGAKQALHQKLGAGAAMTVDLESAAIARVARSQQLPCLVLRAVSDGAADALPRFLHRCRRGDGSLSRGAAAGHAILRPYTWPRLWQMNNRVSRCAVLLAEAVTRYLAAP